MSRLFDGAPEAVQAFVEEFLPQMHALGQVDVVVPDGQIRGHTPSRVVVDEVTHIQTWPDHRQPVNVEQMLGARHDWSIPALMSSPLGLTTVVCRTCGHAQTEGDGQGLVRCTPRRTR